MARTIGSDPYKVLLTLIRSLRTDAGLSQAELAERVGRAQTWVSKIELGERRLDIEDLRQLSEALGKDLVDVVRTWLSHLN